ncbi:MAG: hypothetical protein ABSE40_02425 [Candidatus Sulfotelmatobacter sp.]|jgi:hypothetical protein
MISRLWHGWTTRENADAYERLLRAEILPGIHRVRGFKGAELLRRDANHQSANQEVEFVTESCSRFDARSAHYETVFKLD